MNKGILYAATEEDLVREAQTSAKTVKDEMGDLPIAIVTESETNPDGFDVVINLESPTHGFQDKILAMEKSPFEKTLYLDTDTYMNDDVQDVFEALDHFDIAAVHNQNRDIYTEKNLGVPQCFPEYNSGVVAFNKSETKTFFKKWLKEYSEDHQGDQPSFRKVLYERDLQIATLPNEFNYLPRYPGHIVKDVKIFHGRLLDINTFGAQQYFDLEEVADKVNLGSGHRLYIQGGYQVGPQMSFIQRIERSIKKRGIIGTFSNALGLRD